MACTFCTLIIGYFTHFSHNIIGNVCLLNMDYVKIWVTVKLKGP